MIIGSRFIFREETGSTNVDAASLAGAENTPEGAIVHAGFQLAGRGQKGNKWESERGKNLLFSIILYPTTVSPAEQFIISMVISLGISDYLKTIIDNVKIKWPNDIFAGNDKIAGILIENSISGDSIVSSVAGIGLNVNQNRFPDFVPKAVSLKMLTGKEYDLGECLTRLSVFLDKRYKQLLAGKNIKIKEEYISSLYRLNELNHFRSSGSEFKGRIISVNQSGCLMVETENGRIRDFAFREIEFIH
ncbi:MAG TPA: biotin--[acetyl-CoA-carboxylase] ligase [Bacteroidales bacterium]|jgi:BirA family biotin operon repressor/biotin-[acetyl-CoA-carboxylase] ligase|nr:biotin--[acetyl-CoA-carboxylase] ligase [Bacteroidales bacterium]